MPKFLFVNNFFGYRLEPGMRVDFGLELPIWHPQDLETHQFPGQYVSKNNSMRRVRAGKEWERAGKPLIFFGGCNFRKGKYLRFCRESNSQCGGQGFDPPLLHQITSAPSITYQNDPNKPKEAFDVTLTSLKRIFFAKRLSLLRPVLRQTTENHGCRCKPKRTSTRTPHSLCGGLHSISYFTM